jgi:hypothetical protein
MALVNLLFYHERDIFNIVFCDFLLFNDLLNLDRAIVNQQERLSYLEIMETFSCINEKFYPEKLSMNTSIEINSWIIERNMLHCLSKLHSDKIKWSMNASTAGKLLLDYHPKQALYQEKCIQELNGYLCLFSHHLDGRFELSLLHYFPNISILEIINYQFSIDTTIVYPPSFQYLQKLYLTRSIIDENLLLLFLPVPSLHTVHFQDIITYHANLEENIKYEFMNQCKRIYVDGNFNEYDYHFNHLPNHLSLIAFSDINGIYNDDFVPRIDLTTCLFNLSATSLESFLVSDYTVDLLIFCQISCLQQISYQYIKFNCEFVIQSAAPNLTQEICQYYQLSVKRLKFIGNKENFVYLLCILFIVNQIKSTTIPTYTQAASSSATASSAIASSSSTSSSSHQPLITLYLDSASLTVTDYACIPPSIPSLQAIWIYWYGSYNTLLHNIVTQSLANIPNIKVQEMFNGQIIYEKVTSTNADIIYFPEHQLSK